MCALFLTSLKPCPPPPLGLLYKPYTSQFTSLPLTISSTLKKALCHTNSYNPNKESAKQDMQDKDETQQLSGSDVLWALERATAKKTKKRGTRKDMLSLKAKKKEYEDGGVVDYDYESDDDVRPLCVKQEWGIRLDELERQFNELAEGVS